jgi:hypothetical protein
MAGYWPLKEVMQKGRPVKTWLDEIKKMGKAWIVLVSKSQTRP